MRGYQTPLQRGKVYAVSKQEVAEDSIQGTEVRLWNGLLSKKKGQSKEISLNNIFITTSKGITIWCPEWLL